MDELDSNPLYCAFLTTFRREFDIACKMGFVIAIARASSLAGLKIDQFMANSHILVPSKLLKCHYTPLQVGLAHDVELSADGRQLWLHLSDSESASSPLKVAVLAHELGYNAANKPYRLLLVERPLVATAAARPAGLHAIGAQRVDGPALGALELERAPLRDQEACSVYLERISQPLTLRLEESVKLMQANYVMLGRFLDDAVERVAALASAYVPRYERELRAPLGEPARAAIRLAVENYIVYLLHGKITASLQALYERDDAIVAANCASIARSTADIGQLGGQRALCAFEPSAELLDVLRSLGSLQCPLALVGQLGRLFGQLDWALDQAAKFSQLAGRDGRDGSPTAICSDDLVAALVFSLARARPSRLYSLAKYLEAFGWSATAREQAAFQAATFQVAVHYARRHLELGQNQRGGRPAAPTPPKFESAQLQPEPQL